MRKQKNGFTKLIANVKMNALSLNENGEWTITNSSNNKRRMGNGRFSEQVSDGKKVWTPAKLMITEQDLEEIWNEQNQLCYWFKIPLNFNLLFSNYIGYYPKHPLAPSVDRKDDHGDYTKDNVVICCRLANLGRNIYPFEPFHDVVAILKGEKETPMEATLENFFVGRSV